MTSIFDALFHRLAPQAIEGKGAEVIQPVFTSTPLPQDPIPVRPPSQPKDIPIMTSTPAKKDTSFTSSKASFHSTRSHTTTSQQDRADDSHSTEESESHPSTAADTSNTLSNDLSSTFSTPAVDFGPQSVPFMLRGKEFSPMDSPSRSSGLGHSSLWVPYTPNVTKLNITHNIVMDDDEGESMDIDEASENMMVVNDDELLRSKWRSEQVRFTKRARPGHAEENTITVMHGPLSLPYCRNPRSVPLFVSVADRADIRFNGVDATLADDSSYYTNVFGLRAAAKDNAEASRDTIPRRLPGSAHPSVATQASNWRDTAMGKFGDADSALPAVVSDPYQNIGLRRGVGRGMIPERAPPSQVALDLQNAFAQRIAEVTIDRAKVATSTAIMKLPESTYNTGSTPSASAVLRAQLANAAPKLSPIPASPNDQATDPFFPLAHQAITESTSELDLIDFNENATTHRRETSLPSPARFAGEAYYGDISKTRQTAIAPAINDRAQLYETPAKSNRKTSDESTKSLPPNHTIAVPMRAVPATTITPIPLPVSSKADASGNWRDRILSQGSDKENVTPPAIVSLPNPNTPFVKTIPSVSVTSPGARSDLSSPSRSGIMTMDELLAKFEGTRKDRDNIAFNPPASIDPAIKETSATPLVSRSGPTRSTVSRAGLRESNGQITNAQVSPTAQTPKITKLSNPLMPSRTATTLAKGTPGAGKLLGRGTPSPASIIDENVPPVPDVAAAVRTARSVTRR